MNKYNIGQEVSYEMYNGLGWGTVIGIDLDDCGNIYYTVKDSYGVRRYREEELNKII